MSQTDWHPALAGIVSKQLILAHYILRTILYVTRITLPHSCRSGIITHNTLGLVSCRARPHLRFVHYRAQHSTAKVLWYYIALARDVSLSRNLYIRTR